MERLKHLWKEFAINHEKILKEHGPKDDDYFRYNTFDNLKSKVEQISETINWMLEAVKKVEKEVVQQKIAEFSSTIAAENTDKQQQMQPSMKAKALLFEFER